MGKMIMFFGTVWALTCLAGGFLQGSAPGVSASLTATLSAVGTTINVSSTNGFPTPGIVTIRGERIAYSSKTAATLTGNPARPMIRGLDNTTAVAHVTGEVVRTVESGLVNQAVDYNLAVLSDSAGLMAFIQAPVAIFDTIKTFVATPFGFLGTDLQFITVLWSIAMFGMIVSVVIAMAGGRRV